MTRAAVPLASRTARPRSARPAALRGLVALSGMALLCASCGGGGGGGPGMLGNEPAPLPSPSCAAAPGGGSATVAEPTLVRTLFNRWREGWSGSPALVDLDGDDVVEIIVPRHDRVLIWHADGTLLHELEVDGRIWSSPVVADLLPDTAGLEFAVAARGRIYAYDAQGNTLPGFPTNVRDELRSLAAGDIDGDGDFELVASTTQRLEGGGQRDVVFAVEANGSSVAGFPPNTTGASGCDDACYVTGAFDQNVGLGDLDGDDIVDIVVPHDNAYLSIHDGTGRAFDAASIFRDRTKVLGVRFLHDYAEAQQGYAEEESTALQAHFTNSSPVVANLDGAGGRELIVLGSVQNASQDDRLQGVALWVINPDGTRPANWLTPYHVPDYRAGLWDFDGTNVVGQNNSLAVLDLDPSSAGLEVVFAGFDGRVHAINARGERLWVYAYTQSDRVLTGGVIAADLSGDGVPELVFASYSPDDDESHLFVLDAGGNLLHQLPLPERGAMPIPSIADVNGNGTLEIVVSLKDGVDRERQVLIYEVAGSATNCLPWPTARGNLRRDGYVP